MQVLEGPDDSVDEVLRAILADTRHNNPRILSHKMIHEREFGDWAMAYAAQDGDRPAGNGFLDYSSSREEFSIEGSELSQILAMFQEGLLRQADHHDDGANSHLTVTVTPHHSTPSRQQTKFLLDFGRALALTVPDTQVAVSVGDGTLINFNLRRDMKEGELELF